MDQYNYRKALKEDIREALNERYVTIRLTDEELDSMHDELWIDDAVTGNGSGSYTFSIWKAEEHLCHNLDLLDEALKEMSTEADLTMPESMDVIIRCYLLRECLEAVNNELPEKEDDNDDEDSK